MAYLFSGLIEWLKGLLWQKKLEVGLRDAPGRLIAFRMPELIAFECGL